MTIRPLLKSDYLYFTGLLLLVIGLPVSLFLTSLSQFVLIGAFLFEGDVREKIRRFFNNRPAMLIAGIWLMHIIGLLWTSDLNEGIKDARIKLPLLILPLIIAGNKPLSPEKFRYIILAFVGSVFCGTMISMAVLAGIIHRNIYDIRDIFIFNISHIRFALFTCLCIFILIWIVFRERNEIKTPLKILGVLLSFWFLVFLIIVESVTGLLIFSIAAITLIFYHAFSSFGMKLKIVSVLLIIIFPLTFIYIIENAVNAYYEKHPYPINQNDKTALGNKYYFDLSDTLLENGYPVWAYVCDDELRVSWNSKSKIAYDSTDERKQPLRLTLVRFLTSKGMRKDADAVNRLSSAEIRSIERGVANVKYQDISSLKVRLYEIIWEIDQFKKGRNPSGHSVTQRFEFWKAAIGIASENIFFGVGTGDMPDAYSRQYVKMNTSLDDFHRLRAHNQYLAILVAFGIIGLIYFLFAFLYPLFFNFGKVNFLFAAFMIISVLSMFSEDTLETQPGSTFIALFFSLFLFAAPIVPVKKEEKITLSS